MNQRKLRLRSWFTLSALIISIWSVSSAQPLPAQTAPTAGPTQENDTTGAELARFDQFLDSHREISEQLRKDPSLVNNERFLKDHPASDVSERASGNPRRVQGESKRPHATGIRLRPS
jgi:hypothetical protein